jgi:hypothetical protein
MGVNGLAGPFLDLHIHVGPELITRRYSPDSLAAEAVKSNFGFAAKNHFRPTTADAARLSGRGAVIVGSVVMNLPCGGISVEAVRAGLSGCKVNVENAGLDPVRFIVWMPTIHAEAHLACSGHVDILEEWGGVRRYQTRFPEGGGLSVFEGGLDAGNAAPRLRRAVLEVLDLLASADLILATGHLSAPEVEALVPEAVKRGVKRIILTHPLYQATRLSAAAQKDLCAFPGVYTELAYVNLAIDHLSPEQYADVIRAAGPEKVILSSDLGQVNRPAVTEGWKDYYSILKARGISPAEFETMSSVNPRALVFGDPPR